jgi:hypothetical protein
MNVLYGHQWLNWLGKAPKKGVINIPGNPMGQDNVQGEGPLLVVYPLRRNDQTPLNVLLLDDFMRLSLGSGPCALILDASGRKTQNKGIFTCSYAQMMGEMTSGNMKDTSFWKEERGLLRLNDKAVLTFMEFIESRIGSYADFRKEMLAMLEEREKQNPDLAGFTGKVKELVCKLPEKAPKGSQRVAPGLQVMEKAILIDTPGQLTVSLNATSPVPQVAEPQDVQLAECRRTAKILRARAVAEFVRNPALSKNPAAAAIVKEIQEKSRALLHGPASHEGGETW